MDFKGNIHHKGKESDRIILSEDGDYCYPCSKATYTTIEFGSVNPNIEQGVIISTATGNVEYDCGIHRFIGCGQPKGTFQYPYIYRCIVHPVGYNYDSYLDGVDDLCGYDYYEVDEVLNKEENPNSTL